MPPAAPPPTQTLADWLQDAPEIDALPYLFQRMGRGEIDRIGDTYLDLPALAQPYGCQSQTCAPGRRAPRARSCCADLEVTLSEAEQADLERNLPALTAWMQPRDPRWQAEAPPTLVDPDTRTLRRPGRRCILATLTDAEGLRCGAQAAGLRKPMPCQLFPLAIVDLGEEGHLLTAIHSRTARMLGSRPAAAFPCLGSGPGRTTLAEAEQATLTALYGPRKAQRILKAVRQATA